MPDLSTVARWLVIIGLVLAGAGVLLWALGRTGLPLGRLPGDFRLDTGSFTCFFPLATSVVISLLLTIVLTLIARILSR
jgi:hypothetical protein